MSLNAAHEGYEYQDLLTAYFILSEILNNNDARFIIDRKITIGDAFDDLTIIKNGQTYKKQIKYSNTHTFQKSDISTSGGYQLAIDELYNAWVGYKDKNCQVRLCLAWDEPIDELTQILTKTLGEYTFPGYSTNLFRINIGKLWPEKGNPLSSWKRFNQSSKTIERNRFVDFCNHLLIETNFPKFSLNLDSPGDLESLILEQTDKIGIGIFPNHNLNPKGFILGILHKIKEARSKGNSISSHLIFTLFDIKTDYGAIEQYFPIDFQKNVFTKNTIRELLIQFKKYDKLILVGEPGSGKSWLVNNLIKVSNRKGIHIVRHFCYTDLRDELQKERIKRDTFYGNIIADILNEFPELRERKEHLFASTLSELNILLQSITEPTLLIVDGLDHIERVYNFYQYADVLKQDIQIIEELDKLECSQNVRILLTSQPISDLKNISGFHTFQLPKWGKDEICYILQNYHLDDVLIDEKKISTLLCEKSEGNPLYLTYLIKELKKVHPLTKYTFESLPVYSFNLEEYYNYLITKLNTKESLPRVLSGVSFYLTQYELEEISGEGDYTLEALNTISPVLRMNVSQNGYIIYHESFRRYILDLLQRKNVSIEKNIFQPIIEWFKTKNLFSYPKAYRYGLKFYNDCNKHSEIEPFITKDFVVNSIMFGQPWEQVRKNIKLLANAAIFLKDFRLIFTVNELFKTIDSTTDSYDDSFSRYIECMGLQKGFDHVANLLSFEGAASIDLKQGLEACYICSNYNSFAPWNLYFDYFNNGKNIEIEDFKYYIRYLIIKDDINRIKEIAKNIRREKLYAFQTVFDKEINTIPIQGYFSSPPRGTSSSLTTMRSLSKKKNIDQIISKIFNIKGYTEIEINILEEFISHCKIQLTSDDKCEKVVKQLSARNWFYNWLIFCAKIARLRNNSEYTFIDVKNAFSFLIYDLDPFKGEPRTCDLYYIRDLIYNTLIEGLTFIHNREEWIFAIDTLIHLSQGVTTTIQGSIGGPLGTDKLFNLFDEISTPINNDYLIQKSEELYEKHKDYDFFTYLSGYCFVISKLCNKANDSIKAENYFRLGVRYMVSYTWRRDMTLEDGIDSIVSISKIDYALSKKYIKQLYELANSVIYHTDGKDTKWLPIYWFDEYLRIDKKEAAIWLLNQLYHERYNWILEYDLKSLIQTTNGDVNPFVEQFILNSFIVENSESYLKNMIQVNEKIEKENRNLALFFANKIKTKLEIRQNSAYSDEFQNTIYKHLSLFNINFSVIPKNTPPRNYTKEPTNLCSGRNKELSEMSLLEIEEFIKQNNLTDTDLHSLLYYFDGLQLIPEIKSLISNCVIGKWRNSIENILKLDILFETNLELRTYFNVVVFVWVTDGNFNSFSQKHRFQDAYNYSPNKAIEYLFELLPVVFNGGNRSFSSNLINVLIDVGYKPSIIKESFINIIDAIDFKIPAKESTDWGEALDNVISMDLEEVLICIMLIRTKSYTKERLLNSFSGFAFLLYKTPDKLINPLKWFFRKHEYFLDSVLLCVLDIINDYSEVNPAYIANFQAEFEELYPQKYFLIDCLLERFLNKPAYHQSILLPGLNYPINNYDLKRIIALNNRMEKMQALNFDISNIAGKFKHTFRLKYEDKLDLYSSRSYNRMVQNIYPSDYFLRLINQDTYNDFRELQLDAGEDLYDVFRINTNALITQNFSFILRPQNLPLPSSGEKELEQCPIYLDNVWIRLAHFETELKKGNSYEELFQFRSSGTFSMGHTNVNSLVLDSLYNAEDIYCSRQDGVIFQFIQHDSLENHNLLWLNPLMMRELAIKTSHFLNGLLATNSDNEIVLKYNQWNTQYVGNGDIAGIKDEIPLLQGMELIMRDDYFKKMISILRIKQPQYTIVFLDIDNS